MSLLFTVNTTITGIELYDSRTRGEYDDFLTEGAFFEYIYKGDQYGKGSGKTIIGGFMKQVF